MAAEHDGYRHWLVLAAILLVTRTRVQAKIRQLGGQPGGRSR